MKNSYKSIRQSLPFLRKMNKKKTKWTKDMLRKVTKETKLTNQHTKMVNFLRRNKIIFYA